MYLGGVFYYGFPSFSPWLLVFRVAAPHSLLSPIIHYCHHPARMSLEGTLNGAAWLKKFNVIELQRIKIQILERDE